MKKLFSIIILALLLISTASAISLEYDFNIIGNKVVTDKTVIFDEPVSGNYKFALPSDATGISVYIDDILTEYENEAKLNYSKKVRINYVTKKYLDESNFVFDYNSEFNLDTLSIKLTLPENAKLRSKIQQGESNSIFPDANLITTDGESILIKWEYPNLEKEDNISFLVRFKENFNYFWLWIIALIVIVLLVIYQRLLSKKHKTEIKEVKHEDKKEEYAIKTVEENSKHIQKEDNFESHLKEAEEQVVNVLKLKEGSCEQGTLRIATGFSKATLSRILSELEERKVISKEKRGKKNIVFLRKQA